MGWIERMEIGCLVRGVGFGVCIGVGVGVLTAERIHYPPYWKRYNLPYHQPLLLLLAYVLAILFGCFLSRTRTEPFTDIFLVKDEEASRG